MSDVISDQGMAKGKKRERSQEERRDRKRKRKEQNEQQKEKLVQSKSSTLPRDASATKAKEAEREERRRAKMIRKELAAVAQMPIARNPHTPHRDTNPIHAKDAGDRAREERKTAKKLRKEKAKAGQDLAQDKLSNESVNLEKPDNSSKTKEKEKRDKGERKRKKRKETEQMEESGHVGQDSANVTVPMGSDEAREILAKKRRKEAKRSKKEEESLKVATTKFSRSNYREMHSSELTTESSSENQSSAIREGKKEKRKKRTKDPSSSAISDEAGNMKSIYPQSETGNETGSFKRSTEQISAPPSQTKAPGSRLPKGNVQALIDQAVAQMVTGEGRGQSTRSGSDSSRIATKEGTLQDAKQLTHKEMLVDRLYHTNQLRWLQEEYGLQVKRGKFSQWERSKIKETVSNFIKEQNMTKESFSIWLFSKDKDLNQKALYTEFWKLITSNLEHRPNRAVRIFVRREFQTNNFEGAWSNEEQGKLEKAVQAHGENWSAVSKVVGNRSSEDCRLRWRYFAPKVLEARKRGTFTDEDVQKLTAAVKSICQEDGLDPMSLNTRIPWKQVSQRLQGERTPVQCIRKWQAIQKEFGLSGQRSNREMRVARWTDNDTRIFVERLSKEEDALKRDEFTEVKLGSLRSSDWKMEPIRLLEKWKMLIRQHISPHERNYKTNFRKNLQKIRETVSATDSRVKRKRRSSVQVKDAGTDMIDSEEEV